MEDYGTELLYGCRDLAEGRPMVYIFTWKINFTFVVISVEAIF